jgi:hypothetical protein
VSDTIPQAPAGRLRRSIDYLGNIRERLGDLAGFGTLANELIQNAEDARASSISFDVTDMALFVDNDAKFTDCGELETERDCPWKKAGKPSCDWHNLTWIAAGQKRDREETIGKFGVGFLAAYQVTDHPEVMSGRHWELHEDRDENDERIDVVCDGGCDRCRPVTGTRFVLKFATDPKSPMRKALGQEAVTWKELPALTAALAAAAPHALLFLRHIREIEVRRDGARILHVERLSEVAGSATTVVLNGTDIDETWFVLEGDFKDAADTLKGEHGQERIERVRPTKVRVAVPASGKVNGLLYAGLPTGTSTRLPFHIDASFFPSTDRKRIILDPNSYRTAWNMAALRAAADLVGRHVTWLREQLGPVGLWTMFLGVYQSRGGERAVDTPDVGSFWEVLSEEIRVKDVAWREDHTWSKVAAAPVLLKDEEIAAVPVLGSLGIVPMHREVRPIVQQGLISNELGIRRLSLDMVSSAIEAAGLKATTKRSSAPRYLATDQGLRELWIELDTLLSAARSMGQLRPDSLNRLLGLSIAPSATGLLLLPLLSVHQASDETRDIATGLDGIPLLQAGFESVSNELAAHCPVVTVDAMVKALEATGAAGLAERLADRRFDPVRLLTWLGERTSEFGGDERLIERIRALVAFPAGGRLAPLRELAMPGDFNDPLGFSDVITIPDLHRHRATLEALGVHRLTVGEFVRSHVTRAFADGTPEVDVIRRVMRVLTDHEAALEADEDAKAALQDLPIIECVDGAFRQPSEVVQPSDIAVAVLGADGPIALKPLVFPRQSERLWDWLGIPWRPTVDLVEGRVDRIVESDWGDDEQVAAIDAVCRYLDDRKGEAAFQALIARLKVRSWLPARGDDTWHTPTELFAGFQAHLFESQGTFLEMSLGTQRQISDLLPMLGIRTSAPTPLVVAHLLACAEDDAPVNTAIWDHLSTNAGDPSLAQLRGRRCVYLKELGYHRPDEVFWNGSSLGGRRVILSPDLQRHRPLFDAIGVRETADATDAAAVLREIAGETEAEGTGIVAAIRACWILLENELTSDEPETALAILPVLGSEPTFVDGFGNLTEPQRMYIEDRPQLPALFPPHVRARIVPFDPLIATALREAGARDFSTVVDVAKLEQGDRRPARELDQLLAERWQSIQRVVHLHGHPDAGPVDLDGFERVLVSDLLIRYELNAEPDHPATAPERPAAIYIAGERCLYLRDGTRSGERVLARELALALCGPRNFGGAAPGLLEIIRAHSAADAEAALDELGVSRVAESEMDLGSEAFADLGGIDASPEDLEGDAEPGTLAPGGAEPTGTDEASERLDGDATGEPDDEPEVGRPRPQGQAGPTRGTSRSSTESMRDRAAQAINERGHQLDDEKAASRPPKQDRAAYAAAPEAVLRSYIPAPRDHEPTPDPEAAARRERTDRAGIARALRYEREAGREPQEMPHGNPGFDIASRLNGQVVRHIEVKSLSGPWRDNSPGLSAPQHQLAFEIGDDFWLYVVENAGGPAEAIHTIQDPIGRATHFGFDPAWANVAWDDDAPYDDLEPEAGK